MFYCRLLELIKINHWDVNRLTKNTENYFWRTMPFKDYTKTYNKLMVYTGRKTV